MKDKVKAVFEEVKMPEQTAKKIEQAMRKKHQKCRYTWTGRVAAAAAVLALVLWLSPEVRAAVNDLVVRYFFPDSGITIYEETDENGEVVRVVAVDTESESFANMRDGRLWFTANGEEIDITDQIEENKPFYYTYTDDYGLTHYMAVGYSGTLDNFGVYEFMRENVEGQEEWEGWSNGSGRNFLNPKTEKRYPWVDLVWAEFNVPWPMPGA